MITSPTTSRITTAPIRTLLVTALRIVGVTAVLTALAAGSAFAQFRAYITSPESNNVSVIDTATTSVVATVPVGTYPTAVAVTGYGAAAYVVNSRSNSVSVIDTVLNQVVNTIAVDALPYRIAITPDGTKAYVTHLSGQTVTVIDIATDTVAARLPLPGSYLVAISPDGAVAYISARDAIAVLDTATNIVVATVPIPFYSAFLGIRGLTVSPDGHFVYVTHSRYRGAYVIDTTTNTMGVRPLAPTTPVSDATSAGGAAVSPNGSEFWHPLAVAGVEVVSTVVGGPPLPRIALPGVARSIAFTPDGQLVYITTPGGVFVVEAATKRVLGNVAVALGSYSDPQDAPQIAFTPALYNAGPFRGVPHTLAGRIEAEDYNLGGQSVGYSDATPGHEPGSFDHRDDDVDVKPSSEGGLAVGWINAGEWLAYQTVVQATGTYTIQARVGSAFADRTFHIEVGGVDVTGEVPVPQMRDWDQYTTVSVPDVALTAGPQTVRVVMGPSDFMDLQWIAFVRQMSADPAGAFAGVRPELLIAARIEAEDFDAGGQGVGYSDSTPGNEQGFDVYRTDDVDIKPSGDDGGHAVGWMTAGEWLQYTTTCIFGRNNGRISARVGSALPGRTFHVEIDGVDVTGPIAVPQMADWDQYQTVVAVSRVTIPSGVHVYRVVMGPEDWMDFQWLLIE
jgi:YVTN family beta-propeller protein